VVDTGSTDRTREVAAERGARVFDFPWCDNFAAARNETLRFDSDHRTRLQLLAPSPRQPLGRP